MKKPGTARGRPPHRRESTYALLRAYHERGDLRARERLIEENLPLVRMLAIRYARDSEPLDDLVQVGSLGLIKAVDRFDLGRGVRFTTYATPLILGELRRHFRDHSWSVRVPRRLQELNLRLGKLLDELTKDLSRSPTTAELAQAAGATEEEILEALESGTAYASVSLSAPVGEADGGHLSVESTLGRNDHGYELSEARIMLRDGLAELDGREREIIRLRFFAGMTQSQIAMEVGISQMHVSRLLRGALESMRTAAAPAGRA